MVSNLGRAGLSYKLMRHKVTKVVCMRGTMLCAKNFSGSNQCSNPEKTSLQKPHTFYKLVLSIIKDQRVTFFTSGFAVDLFLNSVNLPVKKALAPALIFVPFKKL